MDKTNPSRIGQRNSSIFYPQESSPGRSTKKVSRSCVCEVVVAQAATVVNRVFIRHGLFVIQEIITTAIICKTTQSACIIQKTISKITNTYNHDNKWCHNRLQLEENKKILFQVGKDPPLSCIETKYMHNSQTHYPAVQFCTNPSSYLKLNTETKNISQIIKISR